MNEIKKATAVETDNRAPIVVLRDKLMSRQGELRAALTDVSTESFIRAVLTSVALNPEILGCSWQSIWNACLKACRDGLLPDGVDAAFIPFKGNINYVPMFQGLLRRFRRSGQFKWIGADVVRQGELFEYWTDQEGVHFKHVPGDSFLAPPVKVYAAATTKDGGIFIAVMSIEEIAKIKAMSRATRDDAPWRMWESEMMKKTALRRLSKMLPSARDLSVEEPPEIEHTATLSGSDADLPRITQPRDARGALDHFAGGGQQMIDHDRETGEVKEDDAPPEPEPERMPEPTPSPSLRAINESIAAAHTAGIAARAAGVQRRAVPPEYRDANRQREALSWMAGWDGEPLPKWTAER